MRNNSATVFIRTFPANPDNRMSATNAPIVNPLAGCSDLPALNQLARALWMTEGARGAAVLVGAGLSREAILSSADLPPPPLWSDLASAMRSQLYPTDSNKAPWDPLRLAEEYRCYFGQAALDAFVREHVRDVAWQPSSRHAALVDLPWADILTTNYDTLIERAGHMSERAYDPIRSEADIAFAKAPRIIKLHGSIGTTDHFIIAEEDFRTYPTQHAAFVNLARQCFVENELCLIGFSGDDPNFLAWAGWVRDHLGSAARRIFLAGALDLSPAKRKYLEARNIAPIDVFPLVESLEKNERHAAANRLILDALLALRPKLPHEWKPRHLPSSVRQGSGQAEQVELKATILHWQIERRSYPGWLVCPGSKRAILRHATVIPRADLLAAIDVADAAAAMVEWCWRHQTALWPIHPSFLASLRRFADPIASTSLTIEDRILVATTLLTHARAEGDTGLVAEMTEFLEAHCSAGSDALSELRYQQALQALNDLDFPRVEALARDLTGPDPAWLLRRASFLSAVGDFSGAHTLISEALADLRERERADRGSLWVRSRLAWALFLNRSHNRALGDFEAWPERFRESRCDPWQEVEALQHSAATARRKQLSKREQPTPNFEPGSFRLPSRTIHFGDTRIEPSDEFTFLFERGGVPARLQYVNMFVAERLDALELCYQPTLVWYLSLLNAGLNIGDAQIDRYFGRVTIAALDIDIVIALVSRIGAARDYWSGLMGTADVARRTFARDRLLTSLELLSRLTIRLDSAHAVELHINTLALAKKLGTQPRFREVLGKLLDNSFQTAAPIERAAMVLADLELPLVSDEDAPEPADWITRTKLHQPRKSGPLRAAIARCLSAAGAKDGSRRAAIGRLTALQVMGALTTRETQQFARLAWEQLDDGDPPLPANTRVFNHYWAQLPVRGRDAVSFVQTRLFGPHGTLDEERLSNMIRGVRSGSVAPNAEQARGHFDTIAALRFKSVDPNDFVATFDAGLRGYDPIQEAHFAGATLTLALAPYLAVSDRTADRLAALEHFATETGSLSTGGAMVPFLTQQPSARIALETLIRRGLMARDSHQVGYASDALHLWLEKHPRGPYSPPEQLIDQLISVVELRQSPGLWRLLDTLVSLARGGWLNANRRRHVEIALGDLLIETDYTRVDPLSERAGTVSLIRQHAFRLAAALQEAGQSGTAVTAWLRAGRVDPLPEVRHALIGDDG